MYTYHKHFELYLVKDSEPLTFQGKTWDFFPFSFTYNYNIHYFLKVMILRNLELRHHTVTHPVTFVSSKRQLSRKQSQITD